FAGWLIREKGVHVLLEAARGLERQADWVIAGAGPARTELEALAARLGVPARFVGHVDSPELLRRADIVGVPTLRPEGFGLAGAEAMAAGAAVVGSDAGGLPEVVGDAGVVVPRGEVAALHSALAQLLSAPEERVRLGTAAAARATSRFALERMIGDHAAALERLLL